MMKKNLKKKHHLINTKVYSFTKIKSLLVLEMIKIVPNAVLPGFVTDSIKYLFKN